MALAADPLAWARAIHLLSSALVAGPLLFAYLIAEPAFQQTHFEPAALDRFRKNSKALVLLSLVLAIASGGAWLVLLARRIGGQSLDQAFGETTWTLLTQTQFGTAWQLRLACGVALGVLLIARKSGVSRGSAVLDVLTLAFGMLFVGMLAWSGHGAATPGELGYVHTVADVLRLVAAASWIGGLAALVMAMRMGFLTPSDTFRATAADILHRFSNLGVASVGILLVTGVVNMWVLAGGLDLQTEYGQLLASKIGIFVVMLGFASVNRLRLTPRLAVDRIYGNSIAEITLGIIIFMIVGALGSMEPAGQMHLHAH